MKEVYPRTEKTTARQLCHNRFVAANASFGFDLFKEILKHDPVQNIFIFPTSVVIALAMTYNETDGETQQAITETLGLKG